jgi:hypothetical protein
MVMIKLTDLMKENAKSTYSFGCVMLYFNFDDITKIRSLISPSDIYTEEGDNTYGLEDEPHTTLLYGLHEGVSDMDVERVLDKYTYLTCKIHNPSLFNNDSYDVLKFEVSGDNLHQTNGDLKQLPHTTSYPNYNPHLTIGYLKKGEGQKYVNMLNTGGLSEFFLIPEYGVYSKPNGIKTQIEIKTKII